MGLLNGQANPQQMLMQMASSNPAVAKALEMTQGKTPQEQMTIAQNLAKSQGKDLNQIKQSLGINL